MCLASLFNIISGKFVHVVISMNSLVFLYYCIISNYSNEPHQINIYNVGYYIGQQFPIWVITKTLLWTLFSSSLFLSSIISLDLSSKVELMDHDIKKKIKLIHISGHWSKNIWKSMCQIHFGTTEHENSGCSTSCDLHVHCLFSFNHFGGRVSCIILWFN